MQIVAKTGFDISIVKACLLGKNEQKYFKMSSAEREREREREREEKKTIPGLLRIIILVFFYLYI